VTHAARDENPSLDPEAATIPGDGVSPAASAAASGSPPGSAAATCATELGRARGSFSRQRMITRSTTGSMSRVISEGATGVAPVFCARNSASDCASNVRRPVYSS